MMFHAFSKNNLVYSRRTAIVCCPVSIGNKNSGSFQAENLPSFYRYAHLKLLQDDFLLAWQSKGECGMSVVIGENEITFGNDIHANDYIIVFVIFFHSQNIADYSCGIAKCIS